MSSSSSDEADLRAEVRKENARALELGVRQTVIASVEEAFEEHFDEVAANDGIPSAVDGMSLIRFRNLPSKVPVVDAKWEAVGIITEYILSRVSYPDFAYHFGIRCIEEYAEDLKTAPTTDSGDYTLIDIENFTAKVNEKMFEMAEKIVERRVTMAEMAKAAESFDVSADSRKGRRHKQEDRLLIISHGSQLFKDSKRNIAIAGVFDGHGGPEIAAYSAPHFAGEIAARLEANDDGELDENALRECFRLLDISLTKRIEKEKWMGGSTAVVCVVDEKNIVFGWVGDSSGFIMDTEKMTAHTVGHKPEREDEVKRIEEAGGHIYQNAGTLRVNGVLSVTRALGDIAARPAVIAEPDFKTVPRDESQIIAMTVSDGITDIFSEKELFQLVEAFILEHKHYDYMDLALYICEQAVNRDSYDNVSCAIVFLKSPIKIWEYFNHGSDEDEE